MCRRSICWFKDTSRTCNNGGITELGMELCAADLHAFNFLCCFCSVQHFSSTSSSSRWAKRKKMFWVHKINALNWNNLLRASNSDRDIIVDLLLTWRWVENYQHTLAISRAHQARLDLWVCTKISTLIWESNHNCTWSSYGRVIKHFHHIREKQLWSRTPQNIAKQFRNKFLLQNIIA